MATAETGPSVLRADCGTREVLKLIADRWTAIVIWQLSLGPRRYTQLEREIGGISQKMLTQTLRRLERDGLVERRPAAGGEQRFDYALTTLGETLQEPLGALCRWAETHLAEVELARTRGDSTP
jgi:DNA-binding HxlR family transcriptional regulator